MENSCGLLTKVDPLRERQLLGVVHRARAAAHILLPGVTARLSSATGLLLTAKRTTDLRTGRGDVHIHNATVGSRRTIRHRRDRHTYTHTHTYTGKRV
jgi:hypothetical protein